MDITGFSQNDFDARAWINDTFAQQERSSLIDKRSFTSSTIARLQVLIRDLNTHLEQDCTNLLRGIPSALIEIDSMTSNATQTAQQVSQLVDELAKLEESEKHVTESLQSKHELKTRLQRVHSTFSKAKHLSTAQQNVKDLFNEKQKYIEKMKQLNEVSESDNQLNDDDLLVKEMVDQLYQVKNTMSTLEGYGVSNKRKNELIKYEAMLISDYMSPRFCKSLLQNQIEKAKRDMQWAKKLGVLCMKSIFTDYLTERCSSSEVGSVDWTSKDALQQFFDSTYSLLQHESYIYKQIFQSNSESSQIQLVESDGNNNDNSFNPLCYLTQYCLENYYKLSPDRRSVVNLVSNQFSQASEFAELVIHFLEQSDYNKQELQNICQLVFNPFLPFQEMYTEKLEKDYLMTQVRDLCKPFHTPAHDEGYHYQVETATQKFFTVTREAADRTLFFTGSLESQAFVRIVNVSI
jgi:pyruvate-formate lyase-activating enzyme